MAPHVTALVRGLASRLVLLGVGLATALGAVELGHRLAPANGIPCFQKGALVWEPDPRFGWFHAAGAGGWGQGCLGPRQREWRASITINALGLRDPPRTRAKPPRTWRVLLLGDSFIEAAQVDDGREAARLLERRLPPPPGYDRVEVVNAGVAAWSTDNQLVFFRREGVRLAPDDVVLAFTPYNDVGENVPTLGATFFAGRKPTFSLRDGALVENPWRPDPPPRDTWRRWAWQGLYRHTHVVPILHHAGVLAAWADDAVPPLVGFAVEPMPPAWVAAWELTQALVRRLAAEAAAAGARFTVAVVPLKFEVGGPAANWIAYPETLDVRWERQTERTTAFLAAAGLRACPLLPAFRAHLAATGRNGYWLWDSHWNPEGQAVAADALAACLGA